MDRFSREIEFFGSVNRSKIPSATICLFGFDSILSAILENLVISGFQRFRIFVCEKKSFFSQEIETEREHKIDVSLIDDH